mgnify:CR=1 FL=1
MAFLAASQIEVIGVDGELKRVAQEALTSRPNFAYTLKEVESDLRRVFATGWFSSCVPDAEDTRDGVKLIIKVGGGGDRRAPAWRARPRARLHACLRASCACACAQSRLACKWLFPHCCSPVFLCMYASVVGLPARLAYPRLFPTAAVCKLCIRIAHPG